MFGILLSAFYAVLTWLVRSVLIKFVLYFALFFVTTEFISDVLAYLLPSSATSGDGGLSSGLAGLSSGVWYFMDLFLAPLGISSLLAAFVTRFIVRRLPVIG